MKFVKKLIVIFAVIFSVSAFSASVHAESINFAEWNQIEETFILADDGVPTNSGLKNSLVKVMYDYPSHRMTILFMLRYDSFTEENNIGLSFNINGGDEITLHLNGDAQYNEDKHFVEFNTYSITTSGVVYFEVLLGIKEGIPEQQTLTAKFYDPDGLVSNTFTAELTPQQAELVTSEDISEQTTKSTNKKVNGSKKTQENKTTEVGKDSESNGITVVYNYSSDDQDNYPVHKVLCISAAAIILTVVALISGKHFLKRKKHRGDED